MAETTLRSFHAFELEQYQAQLAKARTAEPPVEKTQGTVKRQEQLNQRQKQRTKERGQGRILEERRSHS